MKKIVYVDMDGVLCNFQSGIESASKEMRKMYEGHEDDIPGIFRMMKPIDGAIESVKKLCTKYDVYVLSTAPWGNPSAWSDKLLWIQQYLGEELYKRVILSHHKNLCVGDYLIDDRNAHGASEFSGEHILFGSEKFSDWNKVVEYLM